jgi:GNAT superfamily N-acetyltransferase
MFADIQLAARIDRAEAALCAGVVHARGNHSARAIVLPLAGGQAVFVANGSPINKVIGLGFDGALDLRELQTVETAWRERGEPVRVELCGLTDPAIAKMLSERGYHFYGLENVLARPLAQLEPSPAPAIRVTFAQDSEEVNLWKQITVTAFTSMDGTGSVVDDPMERAEMEKVMAEMTSAPGFQRYLAWLDGKAVGGASLRLDDGLAQMCGAGTLPAARGRGVQKALLQRRLLDARTAGCDLAVVTTAPGSRSQENMMRNGFALLYSRAVMIKADAS